MKALASPFTGFLFVVLALATTSLRAETASWPQFRGPLGNGIANADGVPLRFDENENLSWKTPLPGRGWSSPVVVGDSAWLTTAEETEATEEEKKEHLAKLKAGGMPEGMLAQQHITASIRLAVLEVDLRTGELLREIELARLVHPDSVHQLNSFASPTPVLGDGRLHAHFGTYGTFCLDTDSGEVLWEKRLALDHGVGPGSSPFLHDGLLVLICDGVDQQYVAALDAATGEEAWRVERPAIRASNGQQKKSYNTPVLIEPAGGDPQLVCLGAQWLVSHDPKTGEELWRLDHGDGFSIVPRPVFSEKHQLLYLSTGFGKPELLAVRVDGKGDITDGHKIAWRQKKRISKKPSFLLEGDELYVLDDGGVATCFDAASGETLWIERVPGNYSASPLLADGKIYFASQEGKITVIEPGREFRLLAENQLDESEAIMASPLALDGALLVRTKNALYRFGE